MSKREKQSCTDINENLHCLVCNKPINQKKEVSHCIFSKMVLPDYSCDPSICAKVGQILHRPLRSINMHSDIICHSCFNLVTEYATVESKLSSIRKSLTRMFDDSAAEHTTVSGNDTEETHCDLRSKTSYENALRVINEEGKLVIVDELETARYSPFNGESKVTKQRELSKKKQSNAENGSVSRPFSCPVCMKDFRAFSHRVEHMLIHLGEKPWICKECDKSFRTKSALKVHSVKHTGLRPYSCKECNKSFAEKCYLEIHNRIHSGEKPFVCDFCDRHFTRKKDLVVHLKTHTGDKPHVCTQCPKMFAVKSRLERHFKIHSGERPYNCEHCTKTFARKDDYKVHIRQHTGERPFQCLYCEKTFTHHSNRLAHMRTHTGSKKYSCSECNKTFNRRRKLQEHLNEKHCNEVIKETELVQASSPVQETVIHFNASCQMPLSEPACSVVSATDLHTLQPVPVDHTSQVSWGEPLLSANTTYLYTCVPTTCVNFIG